MNMAKIELPYIQAFKDRHGKVRHYYRRKGFVRTKLPGLPGSAEFMAAYAKAGSASAALPKPKEERSPQSIHTLIGMYYASAEFMALRPSSQRPYRNQLERFRQRYGNRSASTIQTQHLDSIFHSMGKTPHAAANLRKRLRRVFALAVRLGWRSDNPVRDTDLGNFNHGEIAPWTEEEIAKFESHWPSGSKERLAFSLMLHTGQRRSDVIRMGRQHIQDGRIRVVQVKTGHPLTIPLIDELAHEIAQHDGLTFLTTSNGKPFSVDGFGNWFRAATKEAGLIGKSPHGLRKAAGRRLAEAGCTAKEIAAVLGHRTLNEVARYTRDADQATLSESAMKKLSGGKTRTT